MNLDAFCAQLNEWGRARVPFLFLIDFELRSPVAMRLSDVDPRQLLYNFNGKKNYSDDLATRSTVVLQKSPASEKVFAEKFEVVHRHLAYGDSFLTNLTLKTKVDTESSLEDIFFTARARYRLWLKDKFLVFSPEQFVKIEDGRIYTYPMKGTIDADIPHAADTILADTKELAEHVTIVDLLRNDLSMVATDVTVSRFRYVEELRTSNKRLLQVSSEIVGDLPGDYLNKLGNIILALLPAGSVSGAPKAKTIQIIKEAEGENRGYYTGVAGIFDGEKLDSGVLIRFIEQTSDGLFYRSGAGITTQSEMEKEYQEIIDKVYVPVN